ncbi:hypothetical protein B0T16DRAFT_454314 [Cercophora newfieldiana]|uniref:Ubiquitin interaction motif protein n=1 Tax=Cercophora newfieldiana TaxID=92897 RepID=A0AA39YFW8_9PEZI|nr:hypothetical protein B0T16DRAFT_454314 [Cercophora newfieldiana]
MAQPSEGDIETVMSITGLGDRALVASALKAKNNNVEAVVNGYYDNPERFGKEFSWDEGVFGSSREGDVASMNNSANPSFVVHAPDNSQVIYGSDPGYYGHMAPSRPPSRANTRSPIGRLVDMTTSEFEGAAPNNKHEEDALLQQAINESLHSNSPQGLPPPPPQQSGVTPGADTEKYFGPANRGEYKADEWAMVPSKGRNPDPAACARKRASDTPAFLRCREEGWGNNHRIGAILMILHTIPAARNALLRTGVRPDYGYGSSSEWWKGAVILPPDQVALKESLKESQATDVWSSDEVHLYPPWTDELHRLVAFLDNTERSYGTADILAESRFALLEASGDKERDFFQELNRDASLEGAVFRTYLDEVSITDSSTTTKESDFAILDSEFPKEHLAMAETLYNIWDMLFYTHTSGSSDDAETTMMATITKPAEVLTFRIATHALPTSIEIPETFYLDRYLSGRIEEMKQIQVEQSAIHIAYQKSGELEQRLTQWVDPTNGKSWDRRVLNKAGIKRCQERITQIKNSARWRNHEEARERGEDAEYYLPDHEKDPDMVSEEANVVAHYEAQIRRLEANLTRINQVMSEEVLPQRKALESLSRHVSSLLTALSDDPKWNPTHKYTLRGVVSQPTKVFVRKRETSLMEMEESAAPTEQWWKLSCEPENDYIVASEATTFDAVVREACGAGSKPILIYATDKAMDEAPEPLPDALKTFVKFDNRHFKMEQAQAEAEAEQPNPLDEMSYLSTLRAAGLHLKKKRSTDSMDSMATNQASAGDIDEDMQDVTQFQFDDDTFGNDGTLGHEDVHELVDISVADGSLSEQQIPLLRRDSPPPQEMQERANMPLIRRPLSGIFEPGTDMGNI